MSSAQFRAVNGMEWKIIGIRIGWRGGKIHDNIEQYCLFICTSKMFFGNTLARIGHGLKTLLRKHKNEKKI